MIDAKKYVRFLAQYPFTARMVFVVGWEDTLQFVYLAWLILNKPSDPAGKINLNIVNNVRRELYRCSCRYSKKNPYVDQKYYQIDKDDDSEKARFVKRVLRYYENHTASETIRFFDLPNTIKVRKALSNCLPKPERQSGKKKGEKRKKTSTDKSFNQLLAEGVPRATAWRAAKRGYYFRKEEL